MALLMTNKGRGMLSTSPFGAYSELLRLSILLMVILVLLKSTGKTTLTAEGLHQVKTFCSPVCLRRFFTPAERVQP